MEQLHLQSFQYDLIYSLQMSSTSPFTTLSSVPKIEDEIYQMTTKVVGEAEAILEDIRKQASDMNRKNRESAHRFVIKVWDAVKDHKKLGISRVNSMIQAGINNIKFELQALEKTTQSSTSILVGMTQKDIQRIIDNVSSSDNTNIIETLEEALVKVENCIHGLWRDLDEMYTYHVFYSSQAIGNKVENMTTNIIKFLRPEREYRDPKIHYEHVRICYNISHANIETASTIERALKLEDNLYNTTNTIHSLHSLYPGVNEHAEIVIKESTALLEKYEKINQDLVNDLLHDYYYFLGTAIRNQGEHVYPQCKRFIINAWKATVESAYTIFKSTVDNHLLIKPELRGELLDDVENSLTKLGEQFRKKAALMTNKTIKNRFINRAQFEDLSTLMRNRFVNATQVINALYTSGLSSISERLRFDVEFIIDQRVPFLSTLTDQNFSPTDVCPLAVEFRDYMTRLLNDLVNQNGIDELDKLLPSNRHASSSEGRQVTGRQTKFLNNLDFQNVIYL